MNFVVKRILQYFFKRFLGKYCSIDLDQANFNGDEVVFRNLELNCKTLNETIKGQTPLKFIQCSIGELRINFQLGLETQVQIYIDKIKIRLIPLDSNDEISKFEGHTDTEDPDNQDLKKEGVIDKLVNSLLQNLEIHVTNVAVMVQTRNSDDDFEPIPTIMLRITRLDYTKTNGYKNGGFIQELHSLLHEKKVTVKEVSLHMMRDRWIDTNEFDQPGLFNATIQISNLEFPFQYPLATHPSTFLLFKGAQNALETKFRFESVSDLTIETQCGNFEVMISLQDLVTLSQTLANLTIKKCSAEKNSNQKSDLSLSQSFLRESKHFKDEFEESLKSDSELMKSIEDLGMLSESYFGLNNTKVSPSQIKIRGKVRIKLICVLILCHKGAEKIEDKIFKIFKQQPVSTSAEIFYEVSTSDKELTFKFSKSSSKGFAATLTAPEFLVKRYLRGSKVESQVIENEQNLGDEIYYSVLEESNYQSLLDVNESSVMIDHSQTVQQEANQFAVIELSPAPHYNYDSSTLLEVQGIDTLQKPNQIKFEIEKVFLHVNSTDLVILLHIMKVLHKNDTDIENEQIKKQNTKPIQIAGYVKGVEVQLYLHKVSNYSTLKQGELPIPDNKVPDGTSISLSFNVNIEQSSQSQTIQLAEFNLNATNKSKNITLMSIDTIQIAQTAIQTQQTKQKNTTQEVCMSDEEDHDIGPIRFVKNSSSLEDGPKVPSENFELEPAISSTKIALDGVNIILESNDIDFLSFFIVQQVQALKHTSNVFDIFSLFSPSNKPRPEVLKTTQLSFDVQDFTFQIYRGSTQLKTPIQALIELNLGQIEVELNQGGVRELSCMVIKLRVKQMMLLDLLSQETEVYNPQKEFLQPSSSKFNVNTSKKYYMEKLLSGNAILHESKPSQVMLEVEVQVCFVEEGSLQSRVDLQYIQTEDTQQLFADLGEMKVNPLQLKINATLKNVSTYFTNKTIKLSDQLLKRIVGKFQNRIQFEHEKNNLKINVQPQKKCKVDSSKQFTHVDFKADNLTCAYQPVLRLTQFQDVLARQVDGRKDGQSDDQMFKSHHIFVLKINRMEAASNTIDHHAMQVEQFQVFFISEKTPTNLDRWVNYSEGGDRINEFGFVSVLDLSNVKTSVKQNKVKITIQSIRVGFCSDLLSEIMVFQKITQASFTPDQAEDLTQTVLFPVSQTKVENYEILDELDEELFKSCPDQTQVEELASEENFVLVIGGVNQSPKLFNDYSKNPSSVSQQKIDFTVRIDDAYFKETTTVDNRKLIHKKPEALGVPKLEVSFEIVSMKVTLFSGADLDFKTGLPITLIESQQTVALMRSNITSQSLLSSSQSTQRSQIQSRDPNYLVGSSKNGLNLEITRQQSQNSKRARVTKRDATKTFQIKLNEICATLRVFGLKNKANQTLTLSVGNAQVIHQKDINSEFLMLDTPYCYRMRNLVEISCVIEAKDQNDTQQDLQLVFSLRPTKFFVRQAEINFVSEFLSSMSTISCQSQAQTTVQPNQSNNSTKKQLFVKSIVIKESEIQISIKNLYNVTLGTFINFDGFTFFIKHFQLVPSVKEPLTLDQALERVYTNQVQQAWKFDTFYRLLSSDKRFRSIGRGVYNILAPVYKPLIGVKYGSVGVLNGLSEGLQDLTGYLQEESYGWTIYFIHKLY